MWSDLLRPLAEETPIVPSPRVKLGRMSLLVLAGIWFFVSFYREVLQFEAMWVDDDVGEMCILTGHVASSPWD